MKKSVGYFKMTGYLNKISFFGNKENTSVHGQSKACFTPHRCGVKTLSQAYRKM